MASNKKLDEQSLEFVLRALACGFGLQATANQLLEDFSVKMSRQGIQCVRDAHLDRIATLRAQLADDVAAIPFANKLTRVAHLDEIAKRTFERRNYPECRAALRQIAEEVGDIHDGATIVQMPSWIEVELTPDEGE